MIRRLIIFKRSLILNKIKKEFNHWFQRRNIGIKNPIIKSNKEDLERAWEACHKSRDAKIKKLRNAYENYIELLEQELGNLAALAHTHGWKSSLIEEGKKARKIIKDLKGSD